MIKNGGIAKYIMDDMTEAQKLFCHLSISKIFSFSCIIYQAYHSHSMFNALRMVIMSLSGNSKQSPTKYFIKLYIESACFRY